MSERARYCVSSHGVRVYLPSEEVREEVALAPWRSHLGRGVWSIAGAPCCASKARTERSSRESYQKLWQGYAF